MSKVKYTSVKLLECIKLSSGKFLPAKKQITGIYNIYGGNGVSGKHNDYFVEEPTIVIGRVGEYCGCVHISTAKSWITDNALYVAQFLKEFDIRYLCYVLNKENLNRLANVSGQPSVSQTNILNFSIKVPPIEVQKYIGETLDKVSEIISLHKKRLEELDNLIKSIFYDMFGDPVLNEKDWETKKLAEALTIIGGYAFKSGGYKDNDGIPVIKIGNINSGVFNTKGISFWDEDENLKKYLLYPDDIVISLTGTVGKDDYANVCILPDIYPCYYLNQRNAKLELNNNLNVRFLLYLLKDKKVKGKLTGINRGIRQANISNRDISNLEVPLPPIQLQNKFAQIVTKIEEQKTLEKQAISESENLFNSLMSKYFD